MFRCATAAVLAVLTSVSFASAADKGVKPAGTWTHTLSDFTVTFTIEADTLLVEVTKTDGTTITANAAYGVTDDGVLFGIVTKVEKTGTDDGPDKGDLFSFTYKVGKDGLTLSDLTSSKGKSDQASQLLEGKYQAKKGK